MIHPSCPKCNKKMKLVIHGVVAREPNSSDDWVHSTSDEPVQKGYQYVCPSCNITVLDNEGYDPTF